MVVNNFQMYSSWIGRTPLIFFTIIAGALSDVFGRKPLMLVPLTGYILSSLVHILYYTFMDALPIEFLFLIRISSLFGGYAVLFLGIYGYGAADSKPEDRTYRMARIDGIETISGVIGTALSPYVFEHFGYYGNSSLFCLAFVLAVLYTIFFVQEPIKAPKEDKQVTADMALKDEKVKHFDNKATNWVQNAIEVSILIPLKGMRSILCKDRKAIVKVVLALQLLSYLLYTFSWQVYRLTFLYMQLVFDTFTPKDYAHLKVGLLLLRSFWLLLVMPFLSRKLKVNDSLLVTICLCFEILSGILSPFATSTWSFSLIYIVGSVGICKYGIVRSLLSKTIDSDEIGKFFSLLAIFSAVGPMIGGPAFQQLYNFTLNSCPGAIFYTFAGLMVVAAFFNGITFLNRHDLHPINKDESHEKKADSNH